MDSYKDNMAEKVEKNNSEDKKKISLFSLLGSQD